MGRFGTQNFRRGYGVNSYTSRETFGSCPHEPSLSDRHRWKGHRRL